MSAGGARSALVAPGGNVRVLEPGSAGAVEVVCSRYAPGLAVAAHSHPTCGLPVVLGGARATTPRRLRRAASVLAAV